MMDNNRENLKRWISDPQGVKPGNRMTRLPLSEDELDDLVTYLLSLK